MQGTIDYNSLVQQSRSKLTTNKSDSQLIMLVCLIISKQFPDKEVVSNSKMRVLATKVPKEGWKNVNTNILK